MNKSISPHLFGQGIDVLLMGGASIVAFVICRVTEPTMAQISTLALVMLLLAHLVNHPHFAHSYQMFYGRLMLYRNEAPSVFARTQVSAVAYGVPLLLIGLLTFGTQQGLSGNMMPMGVMINLMGALVGWHYVKQGFGMVMTDAALKKCYWSNAARKALLLNAYLCWILAWMYLNSGATGAQFWGVFYGKFSIQFEWILLVATAVLLSTVRLALIIYQDLCRHRDKGTNWAAMPWSGIIGYVVSVYLWTIFSSVDPAFLLMIPFFHSLQYLTVVYRCKWTEFNGVGNVRLKAIRALRFFALGIFIGWLGFWLVPGYMQFDEIQLYWESTPEPALILVSFWLFINVHHYFIDNLIWRSTNQYLRENLFRSTKFHDVKSR